LSYDDVSWMVSKVPNGDILHCIGCGREINPGELYMCGVYWCDIYTDIVLCSTCISRIYSKMKRYERGDE